MKQQCEIPGHHHGQKTNMKTPHRTNKTKSTKTNSYTLPASKQNVQTKSENKINLIQLLRKTYGSPAWCFAAKFTIPCLQIIQNKTLRQIVNAEWLIRNETVYNDLQQTTIKKEIKLLTTKAYNRAQQ